MEYYKDAIKNGCCGFNDQKFIFNEKSLLGIKKRIFWLGYNFGH